MSIRTTIASLVTLAILSVASTGTAEVNEPTNETPLTENEVYTYVYGATIAILAHEVGHALIDKFQLPIVAEQEDAADEFATMFIKDAGASTNSTGSKFFQTQL